MATPAASNPLATVDFGDPSKLNFYGAEDADKQEYQKALADSLTALEQRYAQPNWFKIAAGFAKPQLGGFMASLGSAAEAEGERIDQQRAAQLPIAQLRAQLAMSKIGMGQNKAVAEQFKLWQDNGSKPEDLMKLRDFAMATAPNAPVTAAIAKRYDSLVTERQLSSADQANVIGRINTAKALGRPPDPADLARLAQYSKAPDYAPKQTVNATEKAAPQGEVAPTPVDSLAAVDKDKVFPTTSIVQANGNVQTAPLPPAAASSGGNKPPAKPVAVNSEAKPNSQNQLSQEEQNQIAELLGAANKKSPFANKNPNLQPDQANQAPKLPAEKYPLLHPIPDTTDLDETRAAAVREDAKNAANKTEAVFENQFKTVAPYMNPTIIDPYRQSISKVLQYTTDQKTKPVAEKVFNVMGQGTTTAQILKAAQAGLQANVTGGMLAGSFSFSLPVEVWKDAGLSPDEYELANKITAEMAKQVFYEAALKGINLNQISATEFNSLAGVQPNRKLSLKAVVNMEKSKDIDAYYQNRLAQQVVDEIGTRVPKNEIAKFTSVYTNSQAIKKIRKAWDMEKKKLD